MSYNKYSKEMKEAIIARMIEGDETVTDIQRDTGVGINTLYRWKETDSDYIDKRTICEHRHSGIHYVTPNERHCVKGKES